MEWLGNALSSSNGLYIIIAVLVLVGFFALLAKKGIFNIDIKGIKLGASNKERYILRQQFIYISSSISEIFNEIKRTKTWDLWKSKCVCGEVKDVFESIIVFNHISLKDSYITTVQKSIWCAIQKNNMIDQYYKSEEFKHLIYDWCKECIEQLLKIREENSK